MVKILDICETKEFKYIKPFVVKFEQKGKVLEWECAKVHDSVSVLLYHHKKDAFLLVKQLRIPALLRERNLGESLGGGVTYELCAGLMDKGLGEEETIIEEIEEEVGYSVKTVDKIATFYGSLGTSAGRQTLFYAEICDDMRVGDGGGIDGEDIELFYLPVSRADEFLNDESLVKPANLGYAILWWFAKFKSLV